MDVWPDVPNTVEQLLLWILALESTRLYDVGEDVPLERFDAIRMRLFDLEPLDVGCFVGGTDCSLQGGRLGFDDGFALASGVVSA